MPTQLLGVLLHTMTISGLPHVRTELDPLLIIPFLTHHPVQTNSKSPSHCDFGDLPAASHAQMKISAPPFRKTAHCYLRRLHQQEAQDRTPLFGDVSQPSSITIGFLKRNQAEIAGYLLATLKAFGLSDDQHECQRGEWTHTRMSRQSLGLRVLFNFPFYRLAQLSDGWVQPIQQLQQVVTSSARPRSQLERFQARAFRPT